MKKLHDKIYNWIHISNELSILKKTEMELRKEICDEIFNGCVGNFTEIFNIKDFQLTAQSKVILSVDKEKLETISLSQDEKKCIKYSPSLVLSELKKLDDDSKLWDIIIEKPAAPILKLKTNSF